MAANARNHVKTVSCAECRRLKLKCDRVFPCASCRKRGCGALCPDGSLPTRPRAVFQETERLKNKISVLTNRVHDLENALEQLNAGVSPEASHPLLSNALLALARDPETNVKDKEVKRKTKSREDDRIKPTTEKTVEFGEEEGMRGIKEGLGTLAIHSDGRSKFYGPTAGIESLFHNDFNDNEPGEIAVRYQSSVPTSGLFFGPPTWLQEEEATTDVGGAPDGHSPGSTVDTNLGSASASSLGETSRPVLKSIWPQNWFAGPLPAKEIFEVMTRLQRHLPDSEKAWSLCETYFEHAAWLHSSIPRKDFISDVFSRIYDPAHPNGSLTHTLGSPSSTTSSLHATATEAPDHVSPEKSAILFMTFAIGSVLDLRVPANHPATVVQAERYHQLACTALGAAGVVERGSVSCVQCLMLMAYYHLLLDRPNSPQRCWALIGLNVHISQCIGLHRDSGWWNPNPEDVQRRRDVFWELYSFERLQGLTLGLPPSLSLQHIDCEFPKDPDQRTTTTGEVEHSFLWKKRKWTMEVVSEVLDTLLATSKKPVPYTKILEIDRRLRDDLFLNSKETFGAPDPGVAKSHLVEPRISSTMQRVVNLLARETILLLLHRVYLARALNGKLKNIFGSKYGPSVLASYRSACHLVDLHRSLASTDSVLPSRLWFIWNYLLGASIVLAALASKNPWCTIAPGALAELDAAYELFEHGVKSGGARPAQALAIVGRLRTQAHQVFDDIRKTGQVPGLSPSARCQIGSPPGLENRANEELSILSGGRGLKEMHKPKRSNSTTSSAQATPDTADSQRHGQTQADASSKYYMSGSGGIFDTLHPDLMEDLRTTNQLNETNFPGMDWSFDELASWNDVPTTSSVTEVTSAPNIAMATFNNGFERDNAPASMAPNMGPTHPYGFDPFSLNIMEGVEGVRDDLGLVAGGVTWDPSWQSLMDQLGVPEIHPT